jgi:hypothetical protein
LISDFHEFFAAIAESSATLTGLLFVALSVAPNARARSTREGVIQQVRASAALMAFTSALVVSLFGLIPQDNVGWPAIVLGIVGLLFTAAGLRSVVTVTETSAQFRRQLPLFLILLAVFGAEIGGGIALLADRQSTGAVDLICDVLIASLVVGVARAWELVADRDTGLYASLSTLLGRTTRPPLSPTRDRPADEGHPEEGS